VFHWLEILFDALDLGRGPNPGRRRERADVILVVAVVLVLLGACGVVAWRLAT
jgi:hypothetical protein